MPRDSIADVKQNTIGGDFSDECICDMDKEPEPRANRASKQQEHIQPNVHDRCALTHSSTKQKVKKICRTVKIENRIYQIRRMQRTQISAKRERHAACCLFTVIICFVLCWLPCFLVYLVYSILGSERIEIDPKVVFFSEWLAISNSAVNPVIYTIFNREFQKALKVFTRSMSCGKARRWFTWEISDYGLYSDIINISDFLSTLGKKVDVTNVLTNSHRSFIRPVS